MSDSDRMASHMAREERENALEELKRCMKYHGLTIDCNEFGYPRILQHGQVIHISSMSWLAP